MITSATPNELLHRVEYPRHPKNKAFDKSGVYSQLPKEADAVFEALANMLFMGSRGI